MATRVVEGKRPYTGGKAIEITQDKVINLRLREENNLIIWDEGDNEIYVDLQLPDELQPTDAFPVGITTGRAVVDNGWDLAGTIICAKTTSGDNIKLLYADEGTLRLDNGTGTFKQVYFKSDVDALLLALREYIDDNLNTKTFFLTGDSAHNMEIATEIVNWRKSGKMPIIYDIINLLTYTLYDDRSATLLTFMSNNILGYNTNYSNTSISADTLTISYDTTGATGLQRGHQKIANILSTDTNYSTPYTPQYDGSPATKKYVDDSVSVVSDDTGVTYHITVSNSDPASGTASNIITLVP